MIPEGTYRAKGCKPLLLTETKGHDDRFVVTLRITQGPQEGQQIDWRGMLKGGAAPITTAALALFGYDGEADDSVTRNEVEIVVEHEEFDGKTRPQVKYVNDPNRAGNYPELTPAEKTAAKARLKSAMLALSASKPKSVGNDDIPF